MRRIPALILTLTLVLPATSAVAKSKKAPAEPPVAEESSLLTAGTFSGLALREIGPALTSGRVVDLAVDPTNRKRYFAAAAAGGVWRTENAGTTWTPVFDGEGSYSIGCLALDPGNPSVVWVGTGENNSQRSVGYGDGVYKSLDGGASWQRMGLETSEHIGKIVIDPRDTDVVYVAAQGPLWSAGGERGLYKTSDGGATWEAVLTIDEHTGVSDVVLDPRDPDVLYAAAYQRRRRVWTLINGGPGSALYKSTDAGANWRKLESGLPKEEIGRIGLAISPVDPDVLYAIIEAAGEGGGFYRSTDRGATWDKRDDYTSGSPQYYQELVADPVDVDRVYSMDTWMQVTEDGGATWGRVGETTKHVDNHALWIDPEDPDYLLAGCDGGVYESFDRAATWRFLANLPITQFYKIAVDNDTPFYNVYGGTQDNFTLGGPSRTHLAHGISNREWRVTLGGDGFEPQVDPENPDIVYSQWQYGNLNRYDRASGELVDIQPQPAPGEDALRWNWDSALIISPHAPARLYFAAQRVFRSDDRGDTWRPVSGDLTRALDRNQLPVMGKLWSIDAVAKNASTSPYGNVVALSESPLVEGLLYAGTDDGLIQVRAEGQQEWRRVDSFPGVPERTYVHDVEASRHDADTVFAAFNNHKSGDFAPYLMRSTDRGASWSSIAGDLPERGSVYTVAEDHVDPKLLFAGTEFGLFFTVDGGGSWIRLEGGLPTIAVRDLEIQRREEDLVVGTFGRGIWILDDYTPLRGLSEEGLEQDGLLFSPKRAWMFAESIPLGLRGKSFQGDGFYTAANPPHGAVFTYYLKEGLKTRREARREAEKKTEEEGGTVHHPSWEELRAEARQEGPAVVLTVSDADGAVVRRLTGPTGAGFHRVSWDLRYPAPNPVDLGPPGPFNPFSDPTVGPLVVPGTYTVSLASWVDGEETAHGEPRSVETLPLGLATLPAADRAEMLAFQQQTARLQRAVLGAVAAADEAQTRLDHVHRALADTPQADPELARRARQIEQRLRDLRLELSGDRVKRSYREPTPPSLAQRVDRIVSGHWVASTSAPPATQRRAYEIVAEAFGGVLERLRGLVEEDLAQLAQEMEAAGAPWTPGRVPRWQQE